MTRDHLDIEVDTSQAQRLVDAIAGKFGATMAETLLEQLCTILGRDPFDLAMTNDRGTGYIVALVPCAELRLVHLCLMGGRS